MVLLAAFAAGAVPFSGLAARLTAGVDLRGLGSGTVSGTGLYKVSGFGPLAIFGSLDVAKGAVGPLLAGTSRPVLSALSAGAGICGHNWSPLLNGAGGRGISPALGATLAAAPEGAVLLAAGLGGGRLVHQTGLGCLVALIGMVPLLGRRHGWRGTLTAACVAVPIIGKRLAGNAPAPRVGRGRTLVNRLLFDRDPPPAGDLGGRAQPVAATA
ncbi:MAG TPA: glycerol-3-phosphate acyltransferase [Acidimicrobiales bacterium]|nr:glycerol-3-phosphate acyltransferase [Acidimicrobiales bacterium]